MLLPQRLKASRMYVLFNDLLNLILFSKQTITIKIT